MIRAAMRILAGYLAACVAAGAVQVAFVLDATGVFESREAAAAAALLVAMAATQAGTFALPFAVIAKALSDVLHFRGWLSFVTAGVVIALCGYATVVAAEEAGATLRNDTAWWAFISSGAVAGFVYWLVAERGFRSRYRRYELFSI